MPDAEVGMLESSFKALLLFQLVRFKGYESESKISHGNSLIGISEAAQVKVGLSMAPLENWEVQDRRITEDPGNWMAVECVAFVCNCKTKVASVGVVWL